MPNEEHTTVEQLRSALGRVLDGCVTLGHGDDELDDAAEMLGNALDELMEARATIAYLDGCIATITADLDAMHTWRGQVVPLLQRIAQQPLQVVPNPSRGIRVMCPACFAAVFGEEPVTEMRHTRECAWILARSLLTEQELMTPPPPRTLDYPVGEKGEGHE